MLRLTRIVSETRKKVIPSIIPQVRKKKINSPDLVPLKVSSAFNSGGQLSYLSSYNTSENNDSCLDILFEKDLNNNSKDILLEKPKKSVENEELLSQKLNRLYKEKLVKMDLIPQKRLFSTSSHSNTDNLEDFTEEEIMSWKKAFNPKSQLDQKKMSKSTTQLFSSIENLQKNPWLSNFSSQELRMYQDKFQIDENSISVQQAWKNIRK